MENQYEQMLKSNQFLTGAFYVGLLDGLLGVAGIITMKWI